MACSDGKNVNHTLKESEVKDITWVLRTNESSNIMTIKENPYYLSDQPVSKDNMPCIVKKGDTEIPDEFKEQVEIEDFSSFLNIHDTHMVTTESTITSSSSVDSSTSEGIDKTKFIFSVDEFYSSQSLNVLEVFKVNIATTKNICSKNNDTKMLQIKGKYSYEQQLNLCNKIKGNLINWDNSKKRRKFKELINSIPKLTSLTTFAYNNGKCSLLWYVDGEYTILPKSDCAAVTPKDFFCEVPLITIIRMRYSPADHAYPGPKARIFSDHDFQVTLDDYIFDLYSRFGDQIHFNNSKIILINQKNEKFESETENGKLFGRYNWYRAGDEREKIVSRTTLTTCKDDEFTCDNGQCIPLDEHCNGVLDCKDESDESCNLILQDKSEEFRPPTKNTLIGFHLTLSDIEDVYTDDHIIRARIQISATWHDSRVKMIQLRDYKEDNYFNKSQIKWKPSFLLPNVNFKDVLKYYSGTLSYLTMFGVKLRHVAPSIHHSEEAYIYDVGKDAKIGLQEELIADFACSMDLTLFPFDVHPCSIDISLKNFGSQDVHFDVNDITIESQPQSLHLFDTSHLKRHVKKKEYRPNKLTFVFLLTRRYTSFILTTILPCVLIGLLGSLTHLFEKDNFTDRIMVTLSNLIVLASLFSQLSSSYPASAEAKAIDIIFFFYIVKVSIDFVMHTVGGIVRRSDLKKAEEKEKSPKVSFLISNIHNIVPERSRKKIKSTFDYFDSMALWIGLFVEIVFVTFYLMIVGFDRQKIIDDFNRISEA